MIVMLPTEQIMEIRTAPQRAELIVGVLLDFTHQMLTFLRGDGVLGALPFSILISGGTGVTPDFTDVDICDYGHTVRLGAYEVAADALIADAAQYDTLQESLYERRSF